MSVSSDEVFPPIEPHIVDKWDREWMVYLSTEAKAPHLVRSTELQVVTDLTGKSRREVFHSSLTRFKATGALNTQLRIWAEGSDRVGKSVAEIGSGAGFLGKQLGMICTRYLGIDASMIAVAIARGNSPSTCEYLHMSERDAIFNHFGSYDQVVGREFFIHQNYTNALWVVKLAASLLKTGGKIGADFYEPNYAIEQGVIYPAKSPLDKRYASCAFFYKDDEIREVAKAAGVVVDDFEVDLSQQRKLVVFRKP